MSFDIESTGLKADFAFLLSAAFHVVGEPKVKLLSLSQYGKRGNPLVHEEELVRDVLEEMAEADILLTYFGTRFDIPFMNTKALEYRFPFPPPVPHIDLFYTVKSRLNLSRKSLQNVGYVMGLSHEKTPVEGKLWKAASAGNREALALIEAHNEADVRILSEAYEQLRPLIRTHPFVGSKEGCNRCGEALQRRGKAYTQTLAQHYRYVCRSGHWTTKGDGR